MSDSASQACCLSPKNERVKLNTENLLNISRNFTQCIKQIKHPHCVSNSKRITIFAVLEPTKQSE